MENVLTALMVLGAAYLGLRVFWFLRDLRWRITDPIGYYRARTESRIELRLYNALVKRGYRVVTQYPCGPYRIDIALPDYRLAIECDGRKYHSTPEQKRHDRRKDRYFRKHGWSIYGRRASKSTVSYQRLSRGLNGKSSR